MKAVILAAALIALTAPVALAQKPANPDADTPPVTTPSTPTNPKAPVEGRNSFTEAQARSRIEKAGFTKVSTLKLDDKGVWRGTGMKGGKQVNVALDFQGNVTSN
jgi:hypothetical protein